MFLQQCWKHIKAQCEFVEREKRNWACHKRDLHSFITETDLQTTAYNRWWKSTQGRFPQNLFPVKAAGI